MTDSHTSPEETAYRNQVATLVEIIVRNIDTLAKARAGQATTSNNRLIQESDDLASEVKDTLGEALTVGIDLLNKRPDTKTNPASMPHTFDTIKKGA
jgi:hypothetical protein